ncbi:carbohydrate-binding module family 20 domain-containing protein [Streptomyces sp. NPDC059985]|uniref:carbohydrate-binding module family 20 domain-containing protein n=1 Tax=Streptomyces sp. NPDC059985 TaxID=3347025 RepID=UPI003679C1E4
MRKSKRSVVGTAIMAVVTVTAGTGTSHAAQEHTTAAVHFRIAATTGWGDQVFVVGNTPELGAWDPTRAVPASATSYPTWEAHALVSAERTEFKYIIKRQNDTVTWEAGQNRLFAPRPDHSLTTADRFRFEIDTPASGTAPACVTWSDSWRYTSVANNCDTDYNLQVLYTDATTSDCRPVHASSWATFAGYGFTDNRAVAIQDC